MLDKINRNPTPKDLRLFGVTILTGFGLIGGLFYWRGKHQAADWMWVLSSAVFVVSLLSLWLTKWLYLAWMGIGYAIGSVVSRIVLTIIFIFVVTPVGLLFKIMRRDALKIRRNAEVKSYWTDHPKISDKSYYDRLF